MAGIPTFGGPASLGNTGPSVADATVTFSPHFGEVSFGGGGGKTQAVVPWIVAGVVAISLIGAGVWYLS